MPKIIQVIEAIESAGKGIEESPYRNVKRYYTLEGEFLAENDPCAIRLPDEEMFEIIKVKTKKTLDSL